MYIIGIFLWLGSLLGLVSYIMLGSMTSIGVIESWMAFLSGAVLISASVIVEAIKKYGGTPEVPEHAKKLSPTQDTLNSTDGVGPSGEVDKKRAFVIRY